MLKKKTFYTETHLQFEGKPAGISRKVSEATLSNAKKRLRPYQTHKNDHVLDEERGEIEYLIHGTYVNARRHSIEVQHETNAGQRRMFTNLELE